MSPNAMVMNPSGALKEWTASNTTRPSAVYNGTNTSPIVVLSAQRR